MPTLPSPPPFPQLPALPSFVVARQEPYTVEETTDRPPVYSPTDIHRQLLSLLYPKEDPRTWANENWFRKILRLHPKLRTAPGSAPSFPAILIYTIWPGLELAYIDDIQVHTLLKRRRLGSYLLDRGFRDMAHWGIKRVAAFAATSEGYSLLTYKGLRPLDESQQAAKGFQVWLVKAL